MIVYDEDASEFPLSPKKSLIFFTRYLVIIYRDDIIVKKLCDKRDKRGYIHDYKKDFLVQKGILFLFIEEYFSLPIFGIASESECVSLND